MKKLKKKTIVLISIVTFMVLLIGCIAILYLFKLSLIKYDTDVNSSQAFKYDPETDDFKLPSDIQHKKQDTIELPTTDVYADTNVLNVLLVGTDERSKEFNTNARADSMMVLSLNLKEHTAKLVSLERAIGVPLPNGEIDLLTHTFRYGGANLLLETVQECFKVDVDKYVRVNFHTFEQIIDSIGGVKITLSQKEVQGLNGEVNSNAITKQKVHEGENHLDGYDALQYCRQRYIDSDWQRIERQRNTIEAVSNQIKTLNIYDWNTVLDNVLPLVQTNLTKLELTSLLLKAPSFIGVSIEDMTIPKKGTYWGATSKNGKQFFGVDFEENAELLKNFFYN